MVRKLQTIASVLPDPEVLLALAPEEVAKSLLVLAEQNLQNGIFHPNNSEFSPLGPNSTREERQRSPYAEREAEAAVALSEAWNWLRVQGLIVPSPGQNGVSGFMVISRRGWAVLRTGTFDQFRQAADFPKAMLHPAIADKVWISLARGDLSDAVFIAFRTVEERVRAAGHFGPKAVGVDLMRSAFHPQTGPLRDANQLEAEREALMHLFAGAIGSYKNPHSHRTVTIADPREAQEMVVLASHLLRIVDTRSPP